MVAGDAPVLVHNDGGSIDLNGKSYTVWQRGPYRIDIEARNGMKQMHFQVQIPGVNSGDAPKYQYDPETGQFDGMSKSLLRDLSKNYPDYQKGLSKAAGVFDQVIGTCGRLCSPERISISVAWISAEAARVVGADFLQSLSLDDFPIEFEGVVHGGWTTIEGAVLLASWHKSYFGSRSRFRELMDYEIAVNGRGIPDLDLSEIGMDRVRHLVRRGAAFAWEALYKQKRQFSDIKLASYISAAPTLVDPDYYTGNVTFCTIRAGQPLYIDQRHAGNDVVVALFTEDCSHRLPERG